MMVFFVRYGDIVNSCFQDQDCIYPVFAKNIVESLLVSRAIKNIGDLKEK